ncbi:DCC1-like thiol-disulfide oxidoreductase family protein [Nostoc sp. C117]|uniref:DCC1-like thiol-disulfide oxidoreductase family protein n=1 Tax=Nostoc sp. C117 TaxID=3349875 RepID=UPI00370D691E
MVSNASFQEKIETLYKRHQTLFFHVFFAIVWPIAIWLMYVVFPNQLATRIQLSRIIFIGIFVQLLVLGVQKRRYAIKTVREFFTGTTYPINLAILRIFVFGTILLQVNQSFSRIVWLSQLPKELLIFPSGLKFLFSDFIPINGTLAQITSWLLIICSFTAMIGLFTRTSAWLTVILTFYVMGIPQFYGKVNHDHHLLWFAAILAVSRCADVLSLDAIFLSWKRADRGEIEPPGLSRVYALPLRYVWLLFGVIYFFPGLHKVWQPGFDWAFTDNLKYQIYSIWLERNEIDGWMPLLRIDQYPVLYHLAAISSICFELSFIFLVFLPVTRYIAAFGGLLLHNSIGLVMYIKFVSLQLCYVAFFDWNTIFHWIGRRLFRNDMYVVYDGNCKLCRRTIATLRVFDIFERLIFVNALNDQALTSHNLLWLDSQALLADMHAVLKRNSWKGFYAYRVLAARIPIFWPILPLLYIWPIPEIGKAIYRRVADSRTCTLPQSEIPDTTKPNYQLPTYLQALSVVASLLLIGNILFGFVEKRSGWPFSCYPTFSEILGPQVESLEVVPVDTTGLPLTSDLKEFKTKMGSERFRGLAGNIFHHSKNRTEKEQRLSGLWKAISRNDSSAQQIKSVEFYDTTLWTDPEKRSQNPAARSLIYELKL